MIEIQHGCVRSANDLREYTYTEVSVKGFQKDYQSLLEVVDTSKSYTFYVMDDLGAPNIGDFIEGGHLVRRTKPKVNNDWSKWKDKDL